MVVINVLKLRVSNIKILLKAHRDDDNYFQDFRCLNRADYSGNRTDYTIFSHDGTSRGWGGSGRASECWAIFIVKYHYLSWKLMDSSVNQWFIKNYTCVIYQVPCTKVICAINYNIVLVNNLESVYLSSLIKCILNETSGLRSLSLSLATRGFGLPISLIEYNTCLFRLDSSTQSLSNIPRILHQPQ